MDELKKLEESIDDRLRDILNGDMAEYEKIRAAYNWGVVVGNERCDKELEKDRLSEYRKIYQRAMQETYK